MATLASSSSSLRQSILSHSLPLIPTHSFTRRTLLLGLAQASPSPSSPSPSHPPTTTPQSATTDEFDTAKKDNLLTILFGPGLSPEKALVDAWEVKGLEGMRVKSPANGPGVEKGRRGRERRLGEVLEGRLRYTMDTAGEHVVQAHALLSAPSTSLPSLRLPDSLNHYISHLSFPPAYNPPSSSSNAQASPSVGGVGGNPGLDLPVLNPLGMLRYGFRIADEALWESEVEGEAVGGGLDWYAKRLAISTIFLRAESHLLQPSPTLLPALTQLHASLARYHSLGALGLVNEGEVGRQVGEFGMFVYKSWGGLLRSRGWIN